MSINDNEEKILDAAINLMQIKGYCATTTKEIAREAQLSEMTLFRKFGNKQEILNRIIKRHTETFAESELFTRKMKYDLEEDLAYVSRSYQEHMETNKKIVLLAYKESGIHDEISKALTANPKRMKDFLINYLKEMQQLDKIVDLDLEKTVMSFMWMNLGYFSSKFLSGTEVAVIPVETFIEHSVKVFARGLKK